MKVKGVYLALLALALALPQCSVGATTTNCDANSAKPTPSAANLDPEKLEDNAEVLKSARELTNQMVKNYDSTKTLTAQTLLIGSEGQLVDPILVAVLPGPKESISESDQKDQAHKVTQGCTAASSTANTNKQTGAGSGSDGTTSTTELTGIPELLSIAVENGSVTNSINGTTMTLSTSLYGLLTGFHLVQDSSHNYKECYVCVRLGASSTFNVADASSPLTSATRKQVSQWQLKYSFFDQSIRSSRVNSLWDHSTNPMNSANAQVLSPRVAASDLAANATPEKKSAAFNVYANLGKALDDYVESEKDDISSCIKTIKASASSNPGAPTCSFGSDHANKQPANNEGLATLILQGLDTDKAFQDELVKAPNNPALKEWAQNYQTALTAYNNAITRFEADVDNLSKGWNADLTFGQQFPTSTSSSNSSSATSAMVGGSGLAATGNSSSTHIPDYLVGGLDLSWQPKTGNTGSTNTPPPSIAPSVTFNGKGSFYTNPNVALNEKTFRGAQAALQAQWTLASSLFVSDPNDKSKVTLALSGSYQRLSENKDQKGKRPDITSGNLKLTIPFPAGISFPLAVTYGNAQQQQAKGSYVIGNFGFSFDVDKLAALLALKH